jgi:hypothetical protein
MTLEQRIRNLEDRFEIYNLIASHPISADTASKAYIRSIYEFSRAGVSLNSIRGKVRSLRRQPALVTRAQHY